MYGCMFVSTRRIAVAAVFLGLIYSSSASADDIKVLPAERMSELKQEAQQQLTDALKVHRGDAKTLGYSKADIKHGETPSMIRKGEFEVKLKDGTRIAFSMPLYREGN